jgi:probable HAF family extracellular repeat protein
MVAAAVFLVAVGGSAAAPRKHWVMLDLGTLGKGYALSSEALAIDSRGEIIGQSEGRGYASERAFVWRNGTMIALPTGGGQRTYADAIDDRGDVVGSIDSRATLWRNEKVINLGTLPGGSYSDAMAINDAGTVIAGQSGTKTGEHAFMWRAGEMTDLGAVPSKAPYPGPVIKGINERGQIVGDSVTDNLTSQGRVQTYHPLLWQSGKLKLLAPLDQQGGAEAIDERGRILGWLETAPHSTVHHATLWWQGKTSDLGTLPGRPSSGAIAINLAGQILGSVCGSDCHAAIWKDGKATDLGTLGGQTSWPEAINDRGQVVGESETSTGAMHAFVWQSGKMSDLGTLVKSMPTGEIPQSDAVAINASGVIVGWSWTRDGEKHAVRWVWG